MLEWRNITADYGDPSRPVLQNVSLILPPAQILTILGVNGAGKSTLLRAIAGIAVVRAPGEIWWEGAPLPRHLPTHDLAARGIAYVPEGQRIWPSLSVEENIEMGAWTHRRDRAGVRRDLATVYDLLPRLSPLLLRRRGAAAHGLSGGERQMVALARALMLRPRALLLDEPSLGLASGAQGALWEILRRIAHEQRIAVALVEQNARAAFETADAVALLGGGGRLLLQGEARALTWERDIEPLYFADPSAADPTTTTTTDNVPLANTL